MALDSTTLTPMSRASMLNLKPKFDEAKNEALLNEFISEMYSDAILTAGTSDSESHYYILKGTKYRELDSQKMVDEIIRQLRGLFPDCRIDFVPIAFNQYEGYFYETSFELKENEAIVIDWS